jgi:hypothetical protein
MKVWKVSLLTTLLFFVVTASVFYSACEKDPCTNVVCQNGGSCNGGVCRCPLGYENTQCQTLAVTRYLGTYAGYTLCVTDGVNLPQITDTVKITADNVAINTVQVKIKSMPNKILHGYVTNTESVYSIVVTNNDSTANYRNIHTITLQSDNRLSIQGYTLDYTPTDTTISNCSFLSNRKY